MTGTTEGWTGQANNHTGIWGGGLCLCSTKPELPLSGHRQAGKAVDLAQLRASRGTPGAGAALSGHR